MVCIFSRRLRAKYKFLANIVFLIIFPFVMNITDTELATLISMPKVIVDAPKNSSSRASHIKKSFTLESVDKQYSFGGFITQNQAFPENFSVGLTYYPKNEKGAYILLRCNGKHGLHENIPHHAECHVHTTDAGSINNGMNTAHIVAVTQDYITLEEAIQYYVNRINLEPEDRRKHFPAPTGTQTGLFD
jgi:hypothetical protein